MGDVIALKRCETIEDVVRQAVAENPTADSGIIIVFDKITGEMTGYYHVDGLRMAYAGARLSYLSQVDAQEVEIK
jgi:hypothetical protein